MHHMYPQAEISSATTFNGPQSGGGTKYHGSVYTEERTQRAVGNEEPEKSTTVRCVSCSCFTYPVSRQLCRVLSLV